LSEEINKVLVADKEHEFADRTYNLKVNNVTFGKNLQKYEIEVTDSGNPQVYYSCSLYSESKLYLIERFNLV